MSNIFHCAIFLLVIFKFHVSSTVIEFAWKIKETKLSILMYDIFMQTVSFSLAQSICACISSTKLLCIRNITLFGCVRFLFLSSLWYFSIFPHQFVVRVCEYQKKKLIVFGGGVRIMCNVLFSLCSWCMFCSIVCTKNKI